VRRAVLGVALSFSCACVLVPSAQAALFSSCGQVDPVREAFDRLRASYVHEIDSSLLIDAAIKGMESAIDRSASPRTAEQVSDTAPSARPASSRSCGQVGAIHDAFERLRANYQGIDSSLLVEAAINGMVGILDRHSSYLSAKVLAENVLQARGEFGAIGLEFTSDRGTVKVVSPIDGSPAAFGGVRPGDIISEIDSQPLEALSLNQVARMLRGPIGSEIVLTIVRSGESQPLALRLTRAIINVESVKYERKRDVGYIRLASFGERADADVQRAIRELNRQIGANLRGYIIDLRNNSGGLLDQGIAVADDFLTEGEIVSTRGRNRSDNNVYRARRGDATGGKPIIVLINEGSAGSAEIVAGALQDNRRATIIGMESFAQASVQTIIPLSGNNGALRLTTAYYYVPSGRAMEPDGIEPDILVSQSADAEANTVRGARHMIRPEPGRKYDDFQLSYALEHLNAQ
jgi:carboxyl-terminal processing protease